MGCASSTPSTVSHVAVVPGANNERENVTDEAMHEEHDASAAPLIALVAHDGSKGILRDFAKVHSQQLRDFRLTGTGTSCCVLQSEGLETIGGVVSGPLGGDMQIGAMIVEGKISAVFFFRDPFGTHPHNSDIEALCRIADTYQIYFATTYKSASAILCFMHQNLMKTRATSHRHTVSMPEGVDDMANVVQQRYKLSRLAWMSGRSAGTGKTK